MILLSESRRQRRFRGPTIPGFLGFRSRNTRSIAVEPERLTKKKIKLNNLQLSPPTGHSNPRLLDRAIQVCACRRVGFEFKGGEDSGYGIACQ